MQGLSRYILALCLLVPDRRIAQEAQNDAGAAAEVAHGLRVGERDRLWANFTRESAVVGAAASCGSGVQALLFNKSTNDERAGPDRVPLRRPRTGTRDRRRHTGPRGEMDPFASERRASRASRGPASTSLGAYGLGPFARSSASTSRCSSESIEFASDELDTINTGDVGDLIDLHAKWRKTMSSRANTTVGTGLELSLPTGSERKRLGTGELAFNPVVNGRFSWRSASPSAATSGTTCPRDRSPTC
jgi:hypothetical protein